ncbi:hypothetical protein ACH5RR_032515 [Cinchona calisaya]|uniref:Transposase n=1 Tax=Cinchona calisaya TaxID=153742 RepID=A0ABD2YIC2_9GENT
MGSIREAAILDNIFAILNEVDENLEEESGNPLQEVIGHHLEKNNSEIQGSKGTVAVTMPVQLKRSDRLQTKAKKKKKKTRKKMVVVIEILMDDFNVVRFPNEKIRGDAVVIMAMTEFLDCVDWLDIDDCTSKGHFLKWYDKRNTKD